MLKALYPEDEVGCLVVVHPIFTSHLWSCSGVFCFCFVLIIYFFLESCCYVPQKGKYPKLSHRTLMER